jgi:hypothetical protein
LLLPHKSITAPLYANATTRLVNQMTPCAWTITAVTSWLSEIAIWQLTSGSAQQIRATLRRLLFCVERPTAFAYRYIKNESVGLTVGVDAL